MSSPAERLAKALDAIQCGCTSIEQERGHKADCWMPGLLSARAAFVPTDITPWIAITDPTAPPPVDRELIVACIDWPHSTELGRPVPVRIGMLARDGGWSIFGATWTPTHYKVAPIGPRQSRGVAQ